MGSRLDPARLTVGGQPENNIGTPRLLGPTGTEPHLCTIYTTLCIGERSMFVRIVPERSKFFGKKLHNVTDLRRTQMPAERQNPGSSHVAADGPGASLASPADGSATFFALL